MGLDSDVHNADSHLHVEFYHFTDARFKDEPFVRIMVPGDKTNIIEEPVKEYHKERFPRQWLYFQMKNSEGSVIGTLLDEWQKARPKEFSANQMAELQILKFQTVEQVATATDSQLQKVGMGGTGLRDSARSYLLTKNQSESASELEETRKELDILKQQMQSLMAEKKVGRPKKEE